MEHKFEKYGDVVEARIVRNPGNGESRGFGFVEMKTEEGTDKVTYPPPCPLRWGRCWDSPHHFCLPSIHLMASFISPGGPRCITCPLLLQHRGPSRMAERLHCCCSMPFYLVLLKHGETLAICICWQLKALLYPQVIRALDGEEWQGRRLLVERARNVR